MPVRASWRASSPSWPRGARRDPLAAAVARLGCYRGIAELNALTLAAEVVDWRRFPCARAFMGYTRLVGCEYSSGPRIWRGHITKAGSTPVRTALIEAAWAYRCKPALATTLARRQHGASAADHRPLLAGAAAGAGASSWTDGAAARRPRPAAERPRPWPRWDATWRWFPGRLRGATCVAS